MKKAPIIFTKTNVDKHVTQALIHLSVFNILTFRVLYILQLVNACFLNLLSYNTTFIRILRQDLMLSDTFNIFVHISKFIFVTAAKYSLT